ncbi:MAG TPA: hypothetical protein VKB36_11915 [Vicinamibacterales bacterium]|nr:hypothetical protein [Vicinamibacterales bacterium]
MTTAGGIRSLLERMLAGTRHEQLLGGMLPNYGRLSSENTAITP